MDGQFTGFITKKRISSTHLQSALVQASAFKAPANRPAQKNATSDIISSQPIACPSYQSLVVGSGVLWTVKLPVKYLTKNATTDVISSQPIACLSDQQADHVPHRTPSASKYSSQGLSQQLSNLQIRRAIKRNTLFHGGNLQQAPLLPKFFHSS